MVVRVWVSENVRLYSTNTIKHDGERIPHPWLNRGLLILSDDTSFSLCGFSSPRSRSPTHTCGARKLPGQLISAWDEWREEEDEITGVLFRCCGTEALDFPSLPDKLMRSVLLRGSKSRPKSQFGSPALTAKPRVIYINCIFIVRSSSFWCRLIFPTNLVNWSYPVCKLALISAHILFLMSIATYSCYTTSERTCRLKLEKW